MELTIRNIKNEPLWVYLKQTRESIFVDEQGLEPCLIEDSYDNTCTHVLYSVDGRIVASCRIREENNLAYIERISVVKDYRNQSLGKKLILQAIETIESKENFNTIVINAQSHLTQMYGRYGFQVCGHPFESYGSSHTQMIKYLD